MKRFRRNHPDHRLFGAVLRNKREDLGSTQASIAQQVGRTQSWLSRYEQGMFRKIPTLTDLRVLCMALGLNTVELLYECGLIDRLEIQEFAAHLNAEERATLRKAA